MINRYKTESIAKRWGKYYVNKFAHVLEFFVRPHPTEFGFAIYVVVPRKGDKMNSNFPIGK